MAVLVILVLILIVALPIAVVAMIIGAVARKFKTGEDKPRFEETIRAIYVYIILIIALCAIFGGVISTFNYGLEILLPEKNTSSTYNYEQRDYNQNMVDLYTSISVVAVSVPIFIYHSKIAKKR